MLNHPPCHQFAIKEARNCKSRIEFAINALNKQTIGSIREAARVYDVPISTLYGRVRGRVHCLETRPNRSILTPVEEKSLVKWILDLDFRGAAPRQCMVREMADLLLAERVSGSASKPAPKVGPNWVARFVRRQPELRSRFSRKYDYRRAQNEDPATIQAWFDRVRHTIVQYGITPADIYNFDETGFAMGITSTSKVVTRAEYYGRRAVLISQGTASG